MTTKTEIQIRVENLNTRAVMLAREGNAKAAEKLWLEALELDPAAITIRANLARLYFQLSQFKDVLNLSDELSEGDTVTAALAALFGNSAIHLEQHAAALKWFTIANRLRPNEPGLQLVLSNALVATGQAHEAVKLLQDLVRLHPSAFEPLLNLAVALSESGEISRADEIYEQLIGKWPDVPAILTNAARFYAEMGLREKSKPIAKQLIRIEPNSNIGKTILADLYRDDGDLGEATKIWKTILNEAPANLDAYLPLIYTAMDGGEWQEAAMRLEQALKQVQQQFPTRLLTALVELPNDVRQQWFPKWDLKLKELVEHQKLIESNDPRLSNWLQSVKTEQSMIANRTGKPTRGGLQSHELLMRNTELSNSLTEALLPIVKDYRQQHRAIYAQFSDDARDEDLRLSGWGVILRSGGRQLRHSHPEAKISGVVYLSIPKSMGQNSDDEGKLWFSPNPLWEAKEKGLKITPKAGSVVIFPSFLPHETIPFKSKEDRICIAFNAL
jgi:uncharacterized protein (TIGR02466 family)